MVLGSPSASLASKLVFWSPDDDSSTGDETMDIQTAASSSAEAQTSTHDGVSMYVKVFEEMLMQVIDGEGTLFVQSELDCFMKYHKLPYAAKYLFCRLCLRKTDKWHRLSSLKYQSELGDSIREAVDVLCGRPPSEEEDMKPAIEDIIIADLNPTFRLESDPQVKLESDTEPDTRPGPEPVAKPEVKPTVKEEVKPEAKPVGSPKPSNYPIIKEQDREIIDLTFDDEQEGQPEAGPSRSPVYEPASPSLTPRAPDFSVFADDEEQATLLELLDCLTTDELVDIAKQLKIKRQAKRRDALIEDILRSSSTQGTLAFPIVTSRKGKDKPMVQSKLPFGAKSKQFMQTTLPFTPQIDPSRTQQDRVREIVMHKLQKCIRLNTDVVALFRRANLVYFRSTQHTPELLTPALLARAKKWTYASYPYARTRDVWRDRAALLAYEDALAVEAEVDALLESGNGVGWGRGRSRSTMSGTPGPGVGASRTKTPVTPRKAGVAAVDSPMSTRKGKAGAAVEEEESVRVQNARAVKRILNSIYPHWQALVAMEPEVADEDGRRKALQRFECGHVLTRVVCKGAYALGILHEYEQELEVLDALLAQTRWRRGRRGRWHERRALLLMRHLRADKVDPEADEAALEGVIAALTDPDTHVVFRPMLERRLTILEKRLKIPDDERHECAGGLKRAENVCVEGVRVDRRMLLDEAGRVVNQSGEKEGKTAGLLRWAKARNPSPRKVKEEVKPEKPSGKSVWKGRDGEEVSVETLALQYYEDNHGCKGFHSEGRIVTTLFGLLFWDVIFAPVPGAFETRYQAAPLDLAEDTFYYARQALADARLAEVEAGRAAELVGQAYDAHQGKMCVGVRWDLFGREDVVGIAKCLEPAALAVICRLMCEDYAGRTGGVPDLIVRNEKDGWAKFVEVKGPNDSLQENQKVWIDVLLQAGMPVEVCHVHEPGEAPKQAKCQTKTTKKTPRKAGQKRKRAEPDSDEEDVVRILESEDEESVDYDLLDLRTEDEEEEWPVKKRRRRDVPARIPEEPESPVAEKVVRLNSQPEVA